jgi:hypothetical protein
MSTAKVLKRRRGKPENLLAKLFLSRLRLYYTDGPSAIAIEEYFLKMLLNFGINMGIFPSFLNFVIFFINPGAGQMPGCPPCFKTT